MSQICITIDSIMLTNADCIEVITRQFERLETSGGIVMIPTGAASPLCPAQKWDVMKMDVSSC